MQRPTSVTVFGILHIIFGVFGIFGLFATGAMVAAGTSGNNPVTNLMMSNATYVTWLKISTVLGVISTIALIIAGIGLLKLRPWGRKLSIWYGVYAIFFIILGGIINAVLVFRPLLEHAQHSEGAEAAGAIGGVIGGVVGSVVGIVYPILVLIFMTRPKVVAAFAEATPPPIPAPAG